MPFQENNKGLSFPLCVSSNNDQGASNNIAITYANSKLFSQKFIFWFTALLWIFLENILLMCGLNSFQLEISMPFSRFMSLLGSMSDPGLMQSMKSASLIFRFRQCDSKSKNISLSQLIVCFLLLCTCCAIPFVFWLHFTAYWCWYLRVGKNCWVSPR